MWTSVRDKASDAVRLRIAGSSVRAVRSGLGRLETAVVAVALSLALFLPGSALADASLPSVTIGQGAAVTPQNAVTYYQGVDGLTSNVRSTNPDPEITTLAAALRHDPDVIYQWVHDNVELDLTFGLGKGARGAAIDKSGTPFDQAHLMVELLRASGYTASYQFGTITLTGAQFTDWTGISNAAAAQNILNDGGIPASVSGSGSISSVTMLHCWVLATINGVQYAFDPSFKSHTVKTGIGLAGIQSAMGFNASTYLSGVLSTSSSDTSTGAPRIRALNVGSVASQMSGFSTSLLTYLKNTAVLNNGDIDDVIGGRHIVAIQPNAPHLRQATLPYQTTVYATFANDIPNSLRTALTITSDAGSTPLYFDTFYGKVLSINVAGVGGQWQIVADKTVFASFPTPTSPTGTMVFAINHPYAATGPGGQGTYMDRSLTSPPIWSAGENIATTSILIIYGLGTVGPDLGARFALSAGAGGDTHNGCADTSDPPCTWTWGPSGDASLVKSAASWLSQYARIADIYAKMSGGFHQMHDAIGFGTVIVNTAQNSSFHDSLKFNIEAGISFESLSSTPPVTRAVALAGLMSAANTLEGSVGEQTTNTLDPVSVASKFDWLSRLSNQLASGSDWIYEATPSTWGSVQPHLIADNNNSAIVSAQAQAYINAGYNIIIPVSSYIGPGEGWFKQGGQLPFLPGLERGGVIIAYKTDMSSVAYTIVRNASTDKGGGGSADINTDPTKLFSPDANFLEQQYKARQKFYSVNTETGELTFTPPPDLVSGRGDFPYALSFQRVYRSSKNGWTNNLQSSLQVSGNGLSAMGPNSFEAAETLALVAAQLGLAPAVPTGDMASLQAHVAAALTNMWWAERIAANNVTVSMDNSEKSFTRLADNSWFIPGDPATLSGTVTRTFGDAGSNIWNGGWNTPPFSLPPVDASTTPPTRGAQLPCAAGSPPTFTVTDKGHATATFSWLQTASPLCLGRAYHLTSRSYPAGVTVTYNYNTVQGADTVSSVTNSLGRTLTYSAGNSVSDTTDPAHVRTVTFADNNLSQYAQSMFCDSDYHDATGPSAPCVAEIDQVTDADGNIWKYSYAANTGTTSQEFPPYVFATQSSQPPLELATASFPSAPSSPKFTFAFDGVNRIATMKDALLNVWTFDIANGRRGETIDPLGRISSTLYDDRGHVAQSIDGIANAASTPASSFYPAYATLYPSYDGFGRLLQKTNPEGDYEVYGYDTNSNLTSTTRHPKPGSPLANIVTSATYDQTFNVPLTVTDARSNVATNTYYASGLLHTTTGPAVGGGQPVTTYVYTAAGLLSSVTDPTGLVTAYGYDTYGNPLTVTASSGALNLTSTLTYDGWGDALTLQDPNGNVHSATYDAMRRIQTYTAPASTGVGTQWTYNVDGLITQIARNTGTTPASATTGYTYYADGHVQNVTDPDNSVTHYDYDASGALTLTTDPVSRKTKPIYDNDARVIQEIRAYGDPLQQNYATYTFSPNGDKLSVTDADGNLTNYTYDGFDRLSQTTFPSPTTAGQVNASDYEALTYDPNGNVTSKRTRKGDYVLTAATTVYDALNRLTHGEDHLGSQTGTLQRSYDKTYDLAGRVLTETDSLANSLTSTYDTAKRLASVAAAGPQWPAAKTVSYQYDSDSNRTRVTWPDAWYAGYTYDALNRLATVTNSVAGTVATYTYNPLSQRTHLSYANGAAVSYGYTFAGDLTSLVHDLAGTTNDDTTTLGYTTAHQLASEAISNTTWRWVNGPPATTPYVPNGLNQYTSVSGTAVSYDGNGSLTSDGTWTFAYDAENRLTSAAKTGTTAAYAYDPRGRRTMKTVNGVVTAFLDDGDNEIAEYDGSGNLLRRYIDGPAINDVVAVVDTSNNLYYVHADHHGSVIETSQAGAAIAGGPWVYDAYGNVSATTGIPFKFEGMRLDPETGLYYDRARYYSSSLGRFLQTDPIGYGDDLDWYAFVGNDPTDKIDPSGNEGEGCVVGALVTSETGPGALLGCGAGELFFDAVEVTAGLWVLDTQILQSRSHPPRPTIDRGSDGKVHGSPLPKAGDIGAADVEDAIEALKASIKVRQEENDRFSRGDRNSPDPEERKKWQRFKQHQERIEQEKALLKDLERILQQMRDQRARGDFGGMGGTLFDNDAAAATK